jgi:hypothetical protein
MVAALHRAAKGAPNMLLIMTDDLIRHLGRSHHSGVTVPRGRKWRTTWSRCQLP